MDTVTDTQINVAYPQAPELHLKLRLGVCRLTIRPGTGEEWVTGNYHDPSDRMPVEVHQEGGTVRITQGQNVADYLGLFSGLPRFDLALGRGRPYRLSLETGVSDNRFELGGLPLLDLEIKQGTGKNDIRFSEPNPEAMRRFELEAGAGILELSGLAHAGAAELELEGGAATYRLDFSGTLQRDTPVKIETGVSSVEIGIPAATPARVSVGQVLGKLDVGDGFMKREGAFLNEAAIAGGTPLLSIQARVGLGMLQLRIRD